MDENVKKIGSAVLAVIALVLVIKALFFSGGSKYDINSTDPVERMAAVEDYRQDDSGSAREVLIRVAESDNDTRVKISTIHAMRVNQDDKTERTLRRMAESEKSPAVRGEALAALGSYSKVSTNELTSVLGSGAKSPEERMGAAKGLAIVRIESPFPRYSQPCVTLMKRSDPGRSPASSRSPRSVSSTTPAKTRKNKMK